MPTNTNEIELKETYQLWRESTRPPLAKTKRVRQLSLSISASLMAIGILVAVSSISSMAPVVNAPHTSSREAADYPGPGFGEFSVKIDPGSATDVANQLVSKGVIASSEAFLNELKKRPSKTQLKAGSFLLKKEMKASDVIDALSASAQPIHYVAVKTGLTMTQTLALISEKTSIPRSSLDQASLQLESLGVPRELKSLEGFLAPGEYQFPVTDTADQILTKMVKKTKEWLDSAGVSTAEQIKQALTIASIVEAEGKPKDYPAIASAIKNRLSNPEYETSGYLQSDVTVAYGLNMKLTDLTPAQKSDRTNLYNSYVHRGLPPTPIGSPSKEAVQQTVHSPQTNYYYWVTVNLDTGETLFATSYKEHQQNVEKYKLWCQSSNKC